MAALRLSVRLSVCVHPQAMRITLITQSYPPMISGVAVVVARLATALAARGHALLVIAAHADDGLPMRQPEGVSVVRLPSWPNPFRVGQRFVPWPGAAVIAALAAFGPDIVHVHEPSALGQTALRWGRAYGVRTVYTLHQLPWFLTASAPPGLKWIGRLAEGPAWAALKRVLALADAVIAPSRAAAEQVQAHGLLRPHVIGNGTPLDRFQPDPTGAAHLAIDRTRFSLDPALPLVLYVGRLDRDKDVDRVIVAAAQTFRHAPAQLVIAGDGTERARLEQLATRLLYGLPSARFLGYVRDDLPDVYRLARVFITASQIEIQSTVVLEAMASGVPVIAPDVPAMRDLVGPNHAGWLTPSAHPNDLETALRAALADPLDCERRGRAARLRAEAHSLAASVEAHLRLYQVT